MTLAIPIARTMIAALLTTTLVGCDSGDQNVAPKTNDPAVPHAGHSHEQSSAAQFFAAIAEHCGKAYSGRVIADEPASEPDAFAESALVMHVRECGDEVIRIPFMVGDDRSRTWVLTLTDAGLRLKHDHRHEDGSEDDVTQYGGDSDELGTGGRQQFPVDAESIATFERTGLAASVSNTWAMEIEPDTRFLYELSRPSGRLFQVEFDLSAPVDTPPAPWGTEVGDHHDEHAQAHSHDDTKSIELKLNGGERWSTDAALRTGMERIRAAVASDHGPLTAEAAQATASELDASVVYLIQNCELEPEADANLHVLLVEISSAAAALKKDPEDGNALVQVHHALERYPQFFDHPNW